jgi:hypothetical protein
VSQSLLEDVLVRFVLAWREGRSSDIEGLLDDEVIWQGLRGDYICRNRKEAMEIVRPSLGRMGLGDHLEILMHGQQVVLGLGAPDFRKLGDVPIDGQIFQVFNFRDGKVVRIQEYKTREEALVAAERPDRSEWR